MRGYLKGNVEENLSLGTLASGALVSDTWDEAPDEKTLISSIVCTWSLDNLTIGQGPLVFGVAHSDYTDLEIDEVLDSTGSWDRGNKIQREIGKRLVRTIGTFRGDAIDTVFAEGKMVKTKLNWMLVTGETLKMWVKNRSGSSLSTTVPVVKATGHANLWSR